MREVKFRAWIETPEGDTAMIKDYAHVNEYNLQFFGEGDIADDRFCKRVISVMQFTGLRDKNSKDIYEGDILNYTISNHKFTDRVVWQNNGWALLSLNDDSGYPISASYRPKIIGNIFENSDLLNTTL